MLTKMDIKKNVSFTLLLPNQEILIEINSKILKEGRSQVLHHVHKFLAYKFCFIFLPNLCQLATVSKQQCIIEGQVIQSQQLQAHSQKEIHSNKCILQVNQDFVRQRAKGVQLLISRLHRSETKYRKMARHSTLFFFGKYIFFQKI